MIHSNVPHSQTLLKRHWTNQGLRRIPSARTYLKIPIMEPVSGVFISVPGVRTPIPRVNIPATIVGTAMTPATATPAAGLTPHQGSELDKSSDVPQERIIGTAEVVECPELHTQPDTVPMGSNGARVRPEAFVLGRRGDSQ